MLACVAAWAAGGVDYIQVREKDLAPDELASLTREIVCVVRQAGGHTRVLLNGPAGMALSCQCDGVHLPSGLAANALEHVRRTWAGTGRPPVISISCHSTMEMERAREAGATLALFAPVFEKQTAEDRIPGQGLKMLAQACRAAASMPVFALGGVTGQNAGECIEAGASGIAAIRLFASGEWRQLKPIY